MIDDTKQRAEWREATAKGVKGVAELITRWLTEDPESLSGVLIIFGAAREGGDPEQKLHYGGWWAEDGHKACFGDYVTELAQSIPRKDSDAERMFH